MHPDAIPQRMLDAGPQTVYDPAPHPFQPHRQFVYPRLDKRDVRPATAGDCREKGAALASAAAWDKI